MANEGEALFDAYCPPLDPALLSAILSDFDLSDGAALATAREILDALKISAAEEEASAFDPSGSSTQFPGFEDNDFSDRAESMMHSEDTDMTSLSNGLQSLDLGSTSKPSDDVQKLDEGEKEILLMEMFPNISMSTVKHCLKKSSGHFNRAFDELLNHEFFMDGDAGIHAKGVEAFSEENNVRRGRRTKQKKRHRTLDDDDDEKRSSSLPVNGASPWERNDVQFVSSCTNLPVSTVSSIYHQHGASLVATITTLLQSPSLAGAKNFNSASDPVIQVHASELGKDFPSIPSAQLTALIRLTHPSTAAAHELAKALTTPKPIHRGGIEVITRYAPVNISSDDESIWTSAMKPSRSGTTTPITSIDPNSLAAHYSLAQQNAFTQASAAWRRGKSDRLMGGAAAYYSQVGRDFAVKRAEATAEAADELVAMQSSAGQVDLHGVSVKDAVRIARARADEWWRRGGGRKVKGLDGRVMEEERSGLRIVTGVGRHSAGGRAMIGPAIGRFLMTEGWRFTIGEGVYTVTGKNR